MSTRIALSVSIKPQDLFIGFYWDRKNLRLYFLPFPSICIMMQIAPDGFLAERGYELCEEGGECNNCKRFTGELFFVGGDYYHPHEGDYYCRHCSYVQIREEEIMVENAVWEDRER